MGILSINLNLLANSKSKLKSLSSNLWAFSPVTTAFRTVQVHTPRLVRDNKHMFLIQHFLEGSCNHSLLSITGNSWKLDKLHYPFSGHDYYRVADSCNALLLLLYNMGSRSEVALWNPATNEIKTLPQSDVPRQRPVTFTYINGADFGFDPASQDSKVIRFVEFQYDDGTEPYDEVHVELYSLKTNSWKEIRNPHHVDFQKACIHINGFYYWLAFFGPQYGDVILSFDFANEKFCSALIPVPQTDRLKGMIDFVFAEFDGSLAALAFSGLGTEEPFNFEIFVWNDGSWTRVSTVVDGPAAVANVVGLFKNDKLFLQGLKGELLLFDCATSKLENLGIHADLWTVDIFPNVGSSVRLDGKSSEFARV